MLLDKRTLEVIEGMIKTAKAKVLNDYGCQEGDRDWLEANVDSYDQPEHRIRLIVLEGSPAKGFIIVNYGLGEVQAFNCAGKALKRYSYWEWRHRIREVTE